MIRDPVWADVGPLNAVPLRGARCLDTAWGRVGLFRLADGRVLAVENRCPHRGGPLSEGIVHGASVTCPLHGWVISLETGEAEGADEGRVATYPVRVVKGRILLDMTSLGAAS